MVLFFLLFSGLLSSLQALVGNPLLQSSLSNPNLQTTLSSPSLHDSLSSTSLCTSLSSSSLKSSLSSQSLRSSVSSLSLSNQSFQSTASSCSYSSGIGASRSCSSSSLSCSPRTSGQVTVSHTTSSVRRSQLSPLMVPSGEELLWQQPTLSPTLSCITQVRFECIECNVRSLIIKAINGRVKYGCVQKFAHSFHYEDIAYFFIL